MIKIQPGHSGYFSQPARTLDPFLFEGFQLRPDVRQELNDMLLDYLRTKYNSPERWVMVWLAGSAISYQWDADRGNGDLDILFGINYNEFVNCNPEFQWSDRHEITETIDNDLRRNLWPRTARTPIWLGEHHKLYEVTFFLNENVEDTPDSIVNIHPYAAYNVTLDEWTTPPPVLPRNPREMYPPEFDAAAASNLEATKALIDRYNNILAEGSHLSPQSPRAVNNNLHRKMLATQAKNLFDQIHLGRKQAFSQQGEGYADFYNYQWQAAKADGVVNALNDIITREEKGTLNAGDME